MKNSFRLSQVNYERETEDQKVEVQKIFYLSVEGNVTEKEYFEGISRYRQQLGINGIVDVKVLGRSSKDTNSAPKYVLELVEEFLRLRELGNEGMIDEIPEEFIDSYGEEFIKTYLTKPEKLSKVEKNRFITDLRKIGYDINYRKYLATYNRKSDEFGILIDRDSNTHSEENMRDCINHCKQANYHCYISNPCFEFWLLLHLSDVKKEYKHQMSEIQENQKVSKHHTFVSKEVSDKAHHNKGDIKFKNNYLPNVDKAVERAKMFESDEERLINYIGCNLWKLIEILKHF